MHEKILCLINYFFQGLLDKKMKEKYGVSWVTSELVPYALAMQNTDIGYAFSNYIKKGKERGYYKIEDIDSSFAWFIINSDKYILLFNQDMIFFEIVKKIKGNRNELSHIGDVSEIERNLIYNKTFLNIQNVVKDFSDQWIVPEKFYDLYTNLEKKLLGDDDIKIKEDYYETIFDKDYKNVLTLLDMGETDFAKSKMLKLSEQGYAPAILKLAEILKNEQGLEHSIQFLKKNITENLKVKELLYTYENVLDLMNDCLKGNVLSTYYLGIEYEKDTVLPKNSFKAIELFISSCRAGNKLAKEKVIEYAINNDNLALDFIEEDITNNTGVFNDELGTWIDATLNKRESKYYPIVKRIAINWGDEDLCKLARACYLLTTPENQFEQEEIEWLEYAANKGYVKSKFKLGHKYMQLFKRNKTTEVYYKTAEKYMVDAYKQDANIHIDFGDAYYILSLFYLGQFSQGNSIDFSLTNCEKLIDILYEAIQRNKSEAYIYLASIYKIKGMPINMTEEEKNEQALFILNEGAKKGFANVQCVLGDFILNHKIHSGFQVSVDFLMDGIFGDIFSGKDNCRLVTISDTDYKQALYWYEQAAESNDGEAMYKTGKCYLGMLDEYENIRKPLDIESGIGWLEKAANKSGNDYAQKARLSLAKYHLGYLYFDSLNKRIKHEMPRDDKKGFDILYNECNNDRFIDKKYNILLGLCYAFGNGVEYNPTIALEIFNKYKDQDSSLEYNILRGKLYYTLQKYDEAIPVLAPAFQKGHAEALFYAGLCYLTHGPSDNGYSMIRSSADKGYIPAINKMIQMFSNNTSERKIWETKLKDINKKENAKTDNNESSSFLNILKNKYIKK